MILFSLAMPFLAVWLLVTLITAVVVRARARRALRDIHRYPE